MTESQLKFFRLLQTIHDEILVFAYSDKKIWNMDSGYLKNKRENYFKELTAELSCYFQEIASTFFIKVEGAAVLSAILYLYMKHHGVRTSFITYNDIERFLCPQLSLDLERIREVIYELEYNNIIIISESEYMLVRVINKTDRWRNEYFMIPSKPSFVPFANMNFSLTPTVFNKLSHL